MGLHDHFLLGFDPDLKWGVAYVAPVPDTINRVISPVLSSY